MKKKPYHEMELLEFQDAFPNDKACLEYIVSMRWPQSLTCTQCYSLKVHRRKSREVFECQSCGKQFSATAGTMFHKSRIPLRKWFWAIFLMATSKKSVSMLYLQKRLKISQYRTIWLMGHKIRIAMMRREALYGKLNGKVQVDEVWIGGKRTRAKLNAEGQNKTPFLFMVSTTDDGRPRYARLEKLADVTDDQIVPAVERCVAPGSLLLTDGNVTYNQLRAKGYKIDSRTAFYDKEGTAKHLKWVNNTASNVKRFLLSTYHGVPPKYRKGYLAEFAYRLNRRFWVGEEFDRLLYACLLTGSAELEELPELNA